MRESPSLVVVPMLQARGAEVRVFDPQGRRHGEKELPGVKWCASALEAARDADATVVLTEWNEFRAIDLDALAAAMRGDVLVDLRNVFPPADALEAGLTYHSIGRGGAPAGGSSAEEPGTRVRVKPKRSRRG